MKVLWGPLRTVAAEGIGQYTTLQDDLLPTSLTAVLRLSRILRGNFHARQMRAFCFIFTLPF